MGRKKQMIISVDLGYGYVKALNNKNDREVLFHSVVAPAGEDLLDSDLGFSTTIGHKVQIRGKNSLNRNNLLVGELALIEGRAAQMTLSRDRFSRDTSVSLMMTAAYLAGGEGNITLAAGLPLAYYKNQKEAALKALRGLGCYIKVDDGKETLVNFSRVYVYPQCVGALFSYTNIPEKGIIGIIDIGYHTTDYLLAEVRPGGLRPLTTYMSTVEVGIHTAVKRFAKIFSDKTGRPLSMIEAQRLWDKDTVGRRNIDLRPMKEAAREEAGKAVAESVYNAWSEQLDFINEIVLAGGGAIEFYDILNNYLQGVELLDDPQFSNCKGFLSMAEAEELMVEDTTPANNL